jgi:hypothetical protein
MHLKSEINIVRHREGERERIRLEGTEKNRVGIKGYTD